MTSALRTGVLLWATALLGISPSGARAATDVDLLCHYPCDIPTGEPVAVRAGDDATAFLAPDASGGDVVAIYSGKKPSLEDGPFGTTLRCYGGGSQDLFRKGG